MTSVVILGKGKSVLRCTREYIDSFDEVASMNLIRVSGFEKYVSNRCDYLFIQTSGLLGYVGRDKNLSWKKSEHFIDREYYIENKLGIKKIFNIGNHPDDTISKFLDESIEYDFTFRRRMMAQNWEQPNNPERNWFPPAGLLAFEHFIFSNFKKISLVGFDFYEVAPGLDNKDIYNHYYFLDKDNKDESKIGVGERPDGSGHYDNSEFNPHDPKNQINYVITQVKQNPDIEFEIYTNCSKIKEQNFKNLKVL